MFSGGKWSTYYVLNVPLLCYWSFFCGSCGRLKIVPHKLLLLLCRTRFCDTYSYLVMKFMDAEVFDGTLLL